MLDKFFNSFKKITVIEDDDVLLMSIVEALKDEGYVVSTAQSGRQAIGTIKAEKPRLILLDLMLPDMDGMSILKELRESSAWGQKVKVIIFSNLMGDSGLAEKAKTYGVSRYVEKNTVSLEKVLSIIREALVE